MKRIIAAIAVSVLLVAHSVAATPVGKYEEVRFCGEPARTSDGRIARSSAVLYQFKKLYPCPATGLRYGACPGWSMDHVIPLACGGCDMVSNLQWLPDGLKIKAVIGKDRFERSVYETSISCK